MLDGLSVEPQFDRFEGDNLPFFSTSMRAPLTGTNCNYSNNTGALHPHQPFTGLLLFKIIAYKWSWDEAFLSVSPFLLTTSCLSKGSCVSALFPGGSNKARTPTPAPRTGSSQADTGTGRTPTCRIFTNALLLLAMMSPWGAVSAHLFFNLKTKVTHSLTKEHNVNSVALIKCTTRSCELNMSQSLVQILSKVTFFPLKKTCLCIYQTVGSGAHVCCTLNCSLLYACIVYIHSPCYPQFVWIWIMLQNLQQELSRDWRECVLIKNHVQINSTCVLFKPLPPW